MYIEPSSNIRILSGVPLDNSYEHSLFFEGAIAQSTYFTSKTKYYVNDSQYQRVGKGTMKVGYKADLLYDCNYLMFQNESFGNKWFYAFITGVEYINNVTSRITYEIDELQTWHMDYTLNYCFVEREHVESDHIGEHLEDEGLATGEMIYNGYNPMLTDAGEMCVIVLVGDKGEQGVYATVQEGIFSGLTVYEFEFDQISLVTDLINAYAQSYDSIVGIYMCPKTAIPNLSRSTDWEQHKLPTHISNVKRELVEIALSTNVALDGYKPVNNKLYTYPYNYYAIDNSSGAVMKYAYEFFENLSPLFEMNFTVTPPIQVMISPKKYKGVGDKTNNTESIILSNFPICPWVGDAFQAWLGQSALPTAVSGIASTAFATFMNPTVGVLSGVSTVTSILRGAIGSLMNQGVPKNAGNNGTINVSSGKQNFYGGRVSVTSNYAKMIDDYFTRFGYKVCRNKIPNRTNRPHWNYVKTIGCSITGSIPSDSEKKICSIYDKGVTFWKYASEVGDYSNPASNKPQQSE